MNNPKANARKEIGLKLKALREARLFSQAALAERLEISQAGLSKIERGLSSLNTEDLLQILRIFNVPVSYFYPEQETRDHEAILQNALSRLGATELYVNASLPSENLEQANQVIREVLVDGRNPRHIAALAPVFVAQLHQIHLPKLWAEFIQLGLSQRLGWAIENTLEALRQAPKPADLGTARRYRETETALQLFLGSIQATAKLTYDTPPWDVLGVSAPSPRTRTVLEQQSSSISTKWNILSPFQVQDFVDALKATHDAP